MICSTGRSTTKVDPAPSQVSNRKWMRVISKKHCSWNSKRPPGEEGGGFVLDCTRCLSAVLLSRKKVERFLVILLSIRTSHRRTLCSCSTVMPEYRQTSLEFIGQGHLMHVFSQSSFITKSHIHAQACIDSVLPVLLLDLVWLRSQLPGWWLLPRHRCPTQKSPFGWHSNASRQPDADQLRRCPSVQLDLESGTICRRASDSRTCHTAVSDRQSLKTF